MNGFVNPLRRLWADGRNAVNGWIACPSVLSAEALAAAGWDSITVDMQHGTADYADLLYLLPVIERTTTYEAAIAALRRFCLEPRRPLSESDHRATVAYLAALLEEGFEADYQEVWTRGEGRVAPEVIADALERRLGMRMEGRR